jgi:AGCS family alanine or glycine:cation symporter
MYALMAIPNMIAALWLAPKVRDAAKKYFNKMREEKRKKVV